MGSSEQNAADMRERYKLQKLGARFPRRGREKSGGEGPTKGNFARRITTRKVQSKTVPENKNPTE